MSNQQSGRVTISCDGDDLESKSGASIKIGGTKRDGMMTDQKRFRYKESEEVCEIKATMPHVASTDLPKLRNLKDFTAMFTTDIGIVYMSPGAAVMDVGELKDGEVEITIQGPPAEQV